MEAKAITRYLRISPRKLRLVIDAIRSKRIAEAFAILQTLKRKGAQLVAKTLKSAQANANVKKMDENRLYVRTIKADGGPTMKRYMPRSMGRADVILKRMSHLTIILGERELPVPPSRLDIKDVKEKGLNKLKKEKKQKQAVGAVAG